MAGRIAKHYYNKAEGSWVFSCFWISGLSLSRHRLYKLFEKGLFTINIKFSFVSFHLRRCNFEYKHVAKDSEINVDFPAS